MAETQDNWIWRDMYHAGGIASYYAGLARQQVRNQRLFTSASAVLCLGGVVAECYIPVLAGLASILSLVGGAVLVWSLIYDASRKASEASEMHSSWLRLADDLEDFWESGELGDPQDSRWRELRRRFQDLTSRGPLLICHPSESGMQRRIEASAEQVRTRYEEPEQENENVQE